MLLVAAGFAWFVVELNNPAAGSPVLFTIGLRRLRGLPRQSSRTPPSPYPDGRVGPA